MAADLPRYEEPNDREPWAQIVAPMAVDYLIQRGVPATDASWLAPLFLEYWTYGNLEQATADDGGLADVITVYLDGMIQALKEDAAEHRGAWLLILMASISGWGRCNLGPLKRADKDEKAHSNAFAEKFLSHACAIGVDFNDAIVWLAEKGKNQCSLTHPEASVAFMRWLFDRHLVDLQLVIRRERLVGEENWRRVCDGMKGYGFLRDLRFWFEAVGPSSLVQLQAWLGTASRDEFLQLIAAFARFRPPLQFRLAKGSATNHDTDRLLDVFRRVFAQIQERYLGSPDDESLRDWWWTYGLSSMDSSTSWLDASQQKRLVDSATVYLAKLRPLLRSARQAPEQAGACVRAMNTSGPAISSIEPGSPSSSPSLAMLVLECFSDEWSVLRCALLAFRALAVPAVAPDLRYWRVPSAVNPPDPWCLLPDFIAIRIHNYAELRTIDDPELARLRESLAEFLLQRLKPDQPTHGAAAVTDEQMKDKSPHWRRACVRAVRDLRCNPGGRGHRVLYWSSQHDPCEAVRKEAEIAYNELRDHVSLQEGRSPRSALLAAFWWIRRGHLWDLGVEVDEPGALRTRAKEIRRQP